MENPTYLILSRLSQTANTVDVLANNIANASTPGFKAAHPGFSAFLAAAGASPAAQNAGAPGTITFPQDAGIWTTTARGTVSQTGNPLDLAITGKGWFQTQTATGTALTRDGAFGLLPDGTLATQAGDPVLDASGSKITIPQNAGRLTIAADGTISSALAGQIGRIGVVDVANPTTLKPAGNGTYTTSGATSPVATPGIVQGALEGSTVEPVEAVTQMMRENQNFQFATQFAQAEQTRQMNAISGILGQTG